MWLLIHRKNMATFWHYWRYTVYCSLKRWLDPRTAPLVMCRQSKIQQQDHSERADHYMWRSYKKFYSQGNSWSQALCSYWWQGHWFLKLRTACHQHPIGWQYMYLIHRNASVLRFSKCGSRVSGKANLCNWQLELNNLQGLAYEGAGAMAGSTKGAAVRILQQLYPEVLFMHCTAHKLNLCLQVKCCWSVRQILKLMQWSLLTALSVSLTILPNNNPF